MLEQMPSDALAAQSSIVGTGATPEGINQNPAYYEYTFDTAWHTAAQPLATWFSEYAFRRYGNIRSVEATAGEQHAPRGSRRLARQALEQRCGVLPCPRPARGRGRLRPGR